jgi:F0F1-type ATP synthase assembly protein I
MVFGGAVVLGVVLGNYLDHKLGTSPWLVTSGVILGTAAGFAELFRALRHLK